MDKLEALQGFIDANTPKFPLWKDTGVRRQCYGYACWPKAGGYEYVLNKRIIADAIFRALQRKTPHKIYPRMFA